MNTLFTLVAAAISIAFIHTASGPDHYLPFIVFSKSKKWKLSKTIWLTVVCGLGHVLSSILLGLVGATMGWQLSKIEILQNTRGDISSWALLLFGVVYLAYGVWRAVQNKPHKHFDVLGEDMYVYEHKHGESYRPNTRAKVTPLVLFAIFVMGPSEPIIPLLFFSGTSHSIVEITAIISTFTLTTILTMVTMVLIGYFGYNSVQTEKLERFSHLISGGVVSACAAGMIFLGW